MRRDCGEYWISDERESLSPDVIQGFLSRSYWADKREPERTAAAIANSDVYGAYDKNGKQIAFARVITDRATFYYLCDVFVDEAWRGKEVGKRMVDFIVNAEAYKGLSGALATRDAFGLYEKYGFARDDRFMRRAPV